MMKTKWTINLVRELFIENKCILISSAYINNTTHMDYICSCGNQSIITLKNFLKGRRCNKCGRIKAGKSLSGRKKTKEQIDLMRKRSIEQFSLPENREKARQRALEQWRDPLKKENTLSAIRNKKITDERKKEISIFVSNLWKDEAYRSNIISKLIGKKGWNKGIPMTKEAKEKLSKSRSGKNCGPENYFYGKSGELSPNWKGGIQYEPYCCVWGDSEFKEYVIQRDNGICQNPDCWKNSKRISIHHINYDKKDCSLFNLITLCASCNSRANFNREKWKDLYNDLINTKYFSSDIKEELC